MATLPRRSVEIVFLLLLTLLDIPCAATTTSAIVEEVDVVTTSTTTATATSSSGTIPTVLIGQDVYGKPVNLPMIGAGTWQYNDTIAYQSVCKAFQAGYTMVDTAFGYKNQRGVGAAIRDCWDKPRNELFVMTKIPGGLTTKEEVFAAHKQNLIELGLEYVDHLMTHFPSDWDEQHASKELRQEEWLALEEIYDRGEARSIGISHYCMDHIFDIAEVATTLPSINQVEYHVGSQDIDHVREICKSYGITFMSFSPLCGPCEYDADDSLINGKLVTDVASRYVHKQASSSPVSGSQVALRFIVQQGIPVIPKSNTLKHVLSNMDIFDFELSANDMSLLSDATKPAAEGGDCDVP